MPKYLILIQQRRWYKEPAQSFLARGDVPAGTVVNLRVSNENVLSLWLVDGDEENEKELVERMAIAISVNSQKFDAVDYQLFDAGIVSRLDLRIDGTMGKTPDEGINPRHRDLVNVSGKQVVELVRAILLDEGKDPIRIQPKRVKELTMAAFEAERLEWERLNKDGKKKIEEELSRRQ